MYRAAPPASLLIEPLDDLVALYHRASGVTHVLAPPAPELLAALAEAATLDGLADRLGVPDDDRPALAARLGELVEAGLVERG